ncbi:class I SAM-dependent methyltransferase [Salegentibacter mishustinae]|uniref:SAM-dependent methyltransferase n=2 Tax=Salegentibacter mishustinae TaxID=270918 RepID=A0A0Q9Z9S2_9FLAO|nr:SAM-dependent methyltransferase [Salegentibacter mishustinae]KRG29669.1 SAM-dependent methyltransferase [Salegentibacter mishustinae]PNW22080.1 SAM-dependent methyltransferase [Salegentibacter mishustinae]PZX67290.1 thiopurine S-methyltransferase [Salegentibacter mishustinae]GGW80726.1 SAM-dependent methyltransferase [Salegentibacter mishustinae]
MTSNRSFSNEFWSLRYEQNQTGWDIGEISRPLKAYIDQLEDKDLKILIPGAGNAYEAEYLFKQGFKNVYVADISKKPLQNLIARVPTFPKNQLLNINFFEIEDKFDLILEQTFFCALPIDSRKDYAQKTAELLKQNALLSGLLFSFPLTEDGPPFGGSKEEYLTYFSPYFEIEILETSYNSIKPRQGNELFFKFRKKSA